MLDGWGVAGFDIVLGGDERLGRDWQKGWVNGIDAEAEHSLSALERRWTGYIRDQIRFR